MLYQDRPHAESSASVIPPRAPLGCRASVQQFQRRQESFFVGVAIKELPPLTIVLARVVMAAVMLLPLLWLLLLDLVYARAIADAVHPVREDLVVRDR